MLKSSGIMKLTPACFSSRYFNVEATQLTMTMKRIHILACGSIFFSVISNLAIVLWVVHRDGKPVYWSHKSRKWIGGGSTKWWCLCQSMYPIQIDQIFIRHLVHMMKVQNLIGSCRTQLTVGHLHVIYLWQKSHPWNNGQSEPVPNSVQGR
jgi:hypothetical protein